MLTETSPVWFSSRALSFLKGHIQANRKIPTRIFEILLKKIFSLCPSLNLQSAFPLHLRKMLLKSTLMTAGSQEWLFSEVCEEKGRSTLHPSPSPLPCLPDACIPARQFGWPSTASVARMQCSHALRAHSLGLFGFPAVITEGFDFCSLVFWIIYSSCPEHSAPCEQEVACTHVYKLNSSISFIFIHCFRLFCMSIIFFCLVLLVSHLSVF